MKNKELHIFRKIMMFLAIIIGVFIFQTSAYWLLSQKYDIYFPGDIIYESPYVDGGPCAEHITFIPKVSEEIK